MPGALREARIAIVSKQGSRFAPTIQNETARSRATAFPPIPPGSTIESIELIVDEGTDSASLEDPRGVGLSVVDNIFVNGQFVRRGEGIAPSGDGGKGDKDDHDD